MYKTTVEETGGFVGLARSLGVTECALERGGRWHNPAAHKGVLVYDRCLYGIAAQGDDRSSF